jgi:hypothetical protein
MEKTTLLSVFICKHSELKIVIYVEDVAQTPPHANQRYHDIYTKEKNPLPKGGRECVAERPSNVCGYIAPAQNESEKSRQPTQGAQNRIPTVARSSNTSPGVSRKTRCSALRRHGRWAWADARRLLALVLAPGRRRLRRQLLDLGHDLGDAEWFRDDVVLSR